MKTYRFRPIEACEMCGADTRTHRVLGQRLSESLGWRPWRKVGVSVSVLRCSSCGLIYANPQPIPLNLQDHYGTLPETYWEASYFCPDPTYFRQQLDVLAHLQAPRPGRQALDIGAGLGKAMLALESAGFEAYGIEPSQSFYEQACRQAGIRPERLFRTSVEEAVFETERFDFITFGAVLEHLYEPARCLERALDWLRPAGIIHLEVPSARWLLARLMNFYFRLVGTQYVSNLSPMHPPFHLYEFDYRSFVALGQRLGFQIAYHRYDVCQIYHLPRLLHRPLRWYMARTQTGMQLTLYLRKEAKLNA